MKFRGKCCSMGGSDLGWIHAMIVRAMIEVAKVIH